MLHLRQSQIQETKLDDKITGQDYLKSADKTGIEKIEFSSDFVKPYSHDWGNCIEEKLNQCFLN
ncbi:MAG: hypothetical protein ACLTJ5_05460 [Clostridium sp.]